MKLILFHLELMILKVNYEIDRKYVLMWNVFPTSLKTVSALFARSSSKQKF